MWIDIGKLKDWEISIEKVVGGFIWLGFSKRVPHKMLCISSDKAAVFDCVNGTVEECTIDLNEEKCTAVCSELNGEVINLSGQYGGEIPHSTAKGEKVQIETASDYITTVTFITSKKKRSVIYKNYGFYTCGFSYDGRYFVFAQDAGLTVLKKLTKSYNGF